MRTPAEGGSASGGSGCEAIYKYDYLGRRIQKDITQFAVRRTQYYIYDGDNIIAEYDGSVALTAKYVYGPNIDEPIRLENASGVCYYHFDALGSVTDLSNSSGQQVEHYTYSPFGKTKIYDPATGLKRDDSIVGNFYRFTARQWDSESNLYFYRARMYDPNLARFLQADPVGYDADVNLYRYCSNNPINRVDPLGLEGNTRKGKTGHVSINSPIQITGVPTIIVSFHSSKGSMPVAMLPLTYYLNELGYWSTKVGYWVTENWDFLEQWIDIMQEEIERIWGGLEYLVENHVTMRKPQLPIGNRSGSGIPIKGIPLIPYPTQ